MNTLKLPSQPKCKPKGTVVKGSKDYEYIMACKEFGIKPELPAGESHAVEYRDDGTAATNFNYAEVDGQHELPSPDPELELLRAALGLVFCPGPAKVVSARVAVAFGKMYPGQYEVYKLVQIFNTTKGLYNAALMEMASLLKPNGEMKDE